MEFFKCRGLPALESGTTVGATIGGLAGFGLTLWPCIEYLTPALIADGYSTSEAEGISIGIAIVVVSIATVACSVVGCMTGLFLSCCIESWCTHLDDTLDANRAPSITNV